jgi:hypothetical protein
MKSEDWLVIHNEFSQTEKKIKTYIQERFSIESPVWALVLTSQPQFYSNEFIVFNVVVYFEKNVATIIRDIKVTISPLLFVSYDEVCGINNLKTLPAVLDFFESIYKRDKPTILSFSAKRAPKRYVFGVHEANVELDDLGTTIYDFENLEKLEPIELPKAIKELEITAVGSPFHAPYTIHSIDCILFAQNYNEHDVNAIQIRRWFPIAKQKKDHEYIINGTFMYGYVPRTSNSELHLYMQQNNSRILFAKLIDKKIQILGGIEVFEKELINYYLPTFALNFIV